MRLVELCGRPIDGEARFCNPVILTLWLGSPLLEGGDCAQGLRVETPALAVPGREALIDCRLCRFVCVLFVAVGVYVSPSSEAMSVIREEIMLGGLEGLS